jgi:hypothetical protein
VLLVSVVCQLLSVFVVVVVAVAVSVVVAVVVHAVVVVVVVVVAVYVAKQTTTNKLLLAGLVASTKSCCFRLLVDLFVGWFDTC